MTQYSDQGEAGAAEQALLDYVDALLQPPAADPLARLAGGAPTVTPLLRPVRALPQRPFAEPAKPLALRLPLPVVVPAPTVRAPVESPSAITPAPVVVAPPLPVTAPIATPAAASTTIAPPVPAATVPPATVPAATNPTTTAASSEAEPLPPDWLENGRPHWAQQRFECLLFSVGGLRLAVPLVELGNIYQLEADSLTPIFGQADWFMGLLPTKDNNIRVVDAAQVVMPERYSEALRAGYRYIITLNGSDWGLAADSVADAVALDPAEVRWRSERSKRPWLAGTVVAQMCALLDAAQLTWLFHRQDRRRHDP
jgi:purine-binding chemotaxis protein CheW